MRKLLLVSTLVLSSSVAFAQFTGPSVEQDTQPNPSQEKQALVKASEINDEGKTQNLNRQMSRQSDQKQANSPRWQQMHHMQGERSERGRHQHVNRHDDNKQVDRPRHRHMHPNSDKNSEARREIHRDHHNNRHLNRDEKRQENRQHRHNVPRHEHHQNMNERRGEMKERSGNRQHMHQHRHAQSEQMMPRNSNRQARIAQ